MRRARWHQRQGTRAKDGYPPDLRHITPHVQDQPALLVVQQGRDPR
jgi:hypothetical protein